MVIPAIWQCLALIQAEEQRRRGQATVFASVDYKPAGTWNVKSSRDMDSSRRMHHVTAD